MGKIASSRFIVTVGLPPGQQTSWPHGFNFYFRVQDQTDLTQTALYLFGTVADTAMDIPAPKDWSLTNPAITTTPQPLNVADWGGMANYTERNENYTIRSKIWIGPDAFNGRRFPVGLHISINAPHAGIATSNVASYPFRLRAVSPDVEHPGMTAAAARIRKMFIPAILRPGASP